MGDDKSIANATHKFGQIFLWMITILTTSQNEPPKKKKKPKIQSSNLPSFIN
jgi:hypothetical protein